MWTAPTAILFLLCTAAAALTSATAFPHSPPPSRWRRQTIPSEHLVVHSMDSNVSIAARVQVVSSRSRIELRERHLNATISSNSSHLQFDQGGAGTTLLNANGNISSSFQLNGVSIGVVADRLEEESKLTAALLGSVNLSLWDAGRTRIESVGGRMAGIVAESWHNQNFTRRLSIVSAVAPPPNEESTNGTNSTTTSTSTTTTARQLSIAAVSPDYVVQIRLEEAAVSLAYGEARVDISANHRTAVLRSHGRRIELYSVVSPFELVVDALTDALTINCFSEKTTLRVDREDSSLVTIGVGQLSRLSANWSMGGSFRLLPGPTSNDTSNQVERIELISAASEMFLNQPPLEEPVPGSIMLNASQSRLKLISGTSMSTLTSARHMVEMIGGGGQSRVVLETGNITLIITMQPAGSGGAEGGDGVGVNGTLVGGSEDDEFEGVGPPPGSGRWLEGEFSAIPEGDMPSAVSSSPSGGDGTGASTMTAPMNGRPTTPSAPSPLTMMGSVDGDSTLFPVPSEHLLEFITAIEASTAQTGTPSSTITGTPSTAATPSTTTTPSTPTTSDTFVIGQFETTSFSSPRPINNRDSPSGENGLFPILATITHIEMIDNSTPSTTPTPTPAAQPGRQSRNVHKEEEAEGELLQMSIEVGGSVDIQSEEFRSELEESLEGVLEQALQANGSRLKRELLNGSGAGDASPHVHVAIQEVEREEEVDGGTVNNNPSPVRVRIRFVAESPSPAVREELPLLAEKVNGLGEEEISRQLHYKVVAGIISVHHQQRDSSFNRILRSFAKIPIGILILLASVAVVFWVGAMRVALRRYLRRRRAKNLVGHCEDAKHPMPPSPSPLINQHQ